MDGHSDPYVEDAGLEFKSLKLDPEDPNEYTNTPNTTNTSQPHYKHYAHPPSKARASKTKKPNPKKTAKGEKPLPKSELVCGNCSTQGHILADCVSPIDIYGFLNGCPKCNTVEHNYSDCDLRKKNGDDYHYLVKRRHGKPPIRCKHDFRYVDEEKWRVSVKGFRPQTCQFAAERAERGVVQGVDEVTLDPLWDFPGAILSQVHPLDEDLGEGSSSNVPY